MPIFEGLVESFMRLANLASSLETNMIVGIGDGEKRKEWLNQESNCPVIMEHWTRGILGPKVRLSDGTKKLVQIRPMIVMLRSLGRLDDIP